MSTANIAKATSQAELMAASSALAHGSSINPVLSKNTKYDVAAAYSKGLCIDVEVEKAAHQNEAKKYAESLAGARHTWSFL